MEPEGPSAPTSEDRSVKTVIGLAQLHPPLDRPKSTPGTLEEALGQRDGETNNPDGRVSRGRRKRGGFSPARRAHGSIFTTEPASLACLAGLAGVLPLVAGADNFK